VSVGLAYMSCRELVELVTAYLDGALSLEDRMRFEAHLTDCDGCSTYVDQMRRTIELSGTLRVDDVSREAEHVLLQAFRDWRAGT
jgi:anti-sigma factor RsiW